MNNLLKRIKRDAPVWVLILLTALTVSLFFLANYSVRQPSASLSLSNSTVLHIFIETNENGSLSVSGNELPDVLSVREYEEASGTTVFEDILVQAEETRYYLYVLIENKDINVTQRVFDVKKPFAVDFADQSNVLRITYIGDGNIVVLLKAASEYSACTNSPEQIVNIGDKAYVCTQSDTLRLREKPGLQSTVIRSLVPGVTFTITEGPVCADDARWWRIRTTEGLFGWVKEGWDEIDPYFICKLKE